MLDSPPHPPELGRCSTSWSFWGKSASKLLRALKKRDGGRKMGERRGSSGQEGGGLTKEVISDGRKKVGWRKRG